MTPGPTSGMHRASAAALESYMANDPIAGLLDAAAHEGDDDLTCQKWLRSTPPKRYSAQVLYGDLLACRDLRILDIGGGLTSLTRSLAERHSYTLVDLMAHDAAEKVTRFIDSCSPFTAITHDWASSMPAGQYDVVISADLFPNVDQRLDAFLERALSLASEVRLSLTWHSPPRQDLVRRVHGDEIMCMVGWSGDQIRRSLEPLQSQIQGYDPSIFVAGGDSIYPNGRHVCYVSIRRDPRA